MRCGVVFPETNEDAGQRLLCLGIARRQWAGEQVNEGAQGLLVGGVGRQPPRLTGIRE